MLSKLLEPLQAMTKLEGWGDADMAVGVKEKLPGLARVCAALILSLPRYGQLNSVDSLMEEIVAQLKVRQTQSILNNRYFMLAYLLTLTYYRLELLLS